MAALADSAVLYDVVAAALQFLLAGLILAARPRERVHQALAALFAINGMNPATSVLGLPPPWAALLGSSFLDTFAVLLGLVVVSNFPTPLRGRARSVLLAGTLGVAVAWTGLAIAAGGDLQVRGGDLADALHSVPLAAAGALLFFRTVPSTLALDRGPLQTQSLLVAAAFGLGYARVGASNLGDVLAGTTQLTAWLLAAVLPAAGFAAAIALTRSSRASRPAALLLAGFILAGPVLLVLDRVVQSGTVLSLSEFPGDAVRPAVLAFAMVRFQLVGLPNAAYRFLLPAAAAAFLALVFLKALDGLVEPSGPLPAGNAAGPFLALVVVGGVVAAGAWAFPRLGLAGGGRDPQRLEAYRLSLEKARLEPATPEGEARLEAERRRLAITPEEHDVLAVLLERHVFVPAGSVAALQPGQVLAGRYEVVRELGRGGFGRALLAKDREGGALVVVKELLAPWVDDAAGHKAALRREFEAARDVESPHVAPSVALLEDGAQVRLVRAFVPGRTLREVVQARGALPPAEAARVIADVLRGLEALHARGVLHLDLKPENVVLDERGRAVLIDFGAARVARAPGGGATMGAPTLSQPRAGTLAWMAPEQVLGKAVDERTDVYQAGNLLHYALAGQAPVPEGASAYELERAIVEGAPPAPPSCAGMLAGVHRRALTRDPARRFPSAAAMGEAMEGAALRLPG